MILRGNRLATSTLTAAITIAAIVCTPALAEAAPNWMLGPNPGKLPAELTAKAEKTLSLSTEILKVKTTFSCEKLSADSGLLEAEGKSSGTLLFSGCKTILNGTVAPECEPFVGSEKGAVVSKALKGQLVLHEGVTLDQIKAVTGETLATVVMGAACPIGTSSAIIGTFFAKDSNGKFETEEEAHLLEVGPLTELFANSKTAEHKATAAGTVKLSLSGANLGMWWSGLGA